MSHPRVLGPELLEAVLAAVPELLDVLALDVAAKPGDVLLGVEPVTHVASPPGGPHVVNHSRLDVVLHGLLLTCQNYAKSWQEFLIILFDI